MIADESIPARPPANRLSPLLAVLLVFSGPLLWYLSLDHPVLRRTGLAIWPMIAAGVWMACRSLMGPGSRLSRLTAAGVLVLACGIVFMFFVSFKLPMATTLVGAERAPAIEVLDHNGTSRNLANLAGPNGLLLVFYRGHW